MSNQDVTHGYAGRDPECGCIVACTIDTGDKTTADDVADFIRQGLTIDRMFIEEIRAAFGCVHRRAERKAKAQPAPATVEMQL